MLKISQISCMERFTYSGNTPNSKQDKYKENQVCGFKLTNKIKI